MTVKSCGMLDPYWLRDSLVAELGARRVFHLLPYQVERLLIMARLVRASGRRSPSRTCWSCTPLPGRSCAARRTATAVT